MRGVPQGNQPEGLRLGQAPAATPVLCAWIAAGEHRALATVFGKFAVAARSSGISNKTGTGLDGMSHSMS